MKPIDRTRRLAQLARFEALETPTTPKPADVFDATFGHAKFGGTARTPANVARARRAELASEDPATLARLDDKNRVVSGMRTLRLAIADASSALRTLLQQRPALVATLAGAAPCASFGTVPPELVTELLHLTMPVQLSTGDTFTVIDDRLINDRALVRIANADDNDVPSTYANFYVSEPHHLKSKAELGEVAWEVMQLRHDLDKTPNPPVSYDDFLGPACPLATFNEGRQERFTSIVAQVFGAASAAKPAITDRSVLDIGIITYCASDEDLESLGRMLRSWARNLADFGHDGTTIRLSDDTSDPRMQDRVRRLAKTVTGETGVAVEVVGRDKKTVIAADLASATVESAGDALASVGIAPADAAAAIEALFTTPGPSQNRNMALLLSGPSSYVTDDDMLPLTTLEPKATIISAMHADLADMISGTPSDADREGFDAVPYDLLGALSRLFGPTDDEHLVTHRIGGVTDVGVDLAVRGVTGATIFGKPPAGSTKEPFQRVFRPRSEGHVWIQDPTHNSDVTSAVLTFDFFRRGARDTKLPLGGTHQTVASGSRHAKGKILRRNLVSRGLAKLVYQAAYDATPSDGPVGLGRTLLGYDVRADDTMRETTRDVFALIDETKARLDELLATSPRDREQQASLREAQRDIREIAEAFGLTVDEALDVSARPALVERIVEAALPDVSAAVRQYGLALYLWPALERAADEVRP